MSEIERLIGLLELRTDEYRVYAVEAAEAEVAYKKAHAIAHLKATGTVSEREAEATLAADGELLKRRSAEAVRDSCLEAMRSLRAQLSALQTLARMEYDQTGPG